MAGGLNLYGYADGDPINFSDPFGLCTPFPECLAQALANWGASRGGAVGGAALTAGATLNAAFEASGVNLAGQAGAELRQGEFGKSLLHTAMVVPVGRAGRAVGALRTQGRNLAEQLTMAEARGGAGVEIMAGKVSDARYPAGTWAKMSHTHKHPGGHQTEVHYWKNRESGATEGFKYKDP